MAKVKMDAEGVEALKNFAAALPEATEAITQAANALKSSFDEKKELLGPHTSQIEQILETVHQAQATGQVSVVKVQSSLVKAAAKLNAIISRNFNVNGGN